MTIIVNPKNRKESEKIKTILKAIEVDFVEESSEKYLLSEITEAEKESIELGLKDAEEGKFKPHSEVKKLYEKWL